jgi:outer membrane phospholipase A
MRLRPFALLVLFLASGRLWALDLALVPVEREVGAGASFSVALIASNDGAEPLDYFPPPRVDLRAKIGDTEQTLSLARIGDQTDPVNIAAGSYARILYSGPMPEALAGDIALHPINIQANAVAIHVVPGQSAAAEQSRLSSALSPYDPIYFSVGSRGNTNARFQISLKFRVFNPETKTPFLEKLYVAYSQTSIWDLESSSKPFFDSSYRPSVFFLDESLSQWPFSGSRLGMQAGLEHESNGKEGTSSRSINIAFVRPALTFPLGSDYQLTLAPKIYYYLEKDENPDIDDYRGNVDFLLRVGREDGWLLDTTLRNGHQSGKGSIQMDASYPLRIATFGNLGGYLHLQYFNGYGESLLGYNLKLRSQFRIGLMVTRGQRW